MPGITVESFERENFTTTNTPVVVVIVVVVVVVYDCYMPVRL